MVTDTLVVLSAISSFIRREFCEDKKWKFKSTDDDFELVEGDPLDQIAFAYCQFDDIIDNKRIVVDEQWYANVIDKCVWCELDDYIPTDDTDLFIKFKDYQDMKEFFDVLDYDSIIGDADGYVKEHIDIFQEV